MKKLLVCASFLFLAGCGPITGSGGKKPSHHDMTTVATTDMATSPTDIAGAVGGVTSLTITPNPATVMAQVQNGAVTTTPLVVGARDQNGNAVIAAWQIDRGELGTLSPTGTFTANGLNGGVA